MSEIRQNQMTEIEIQAARILLDAAKSFGKELSIDDAKRVVVAAGLQRANEMHPGTLESILHVFKEKCHAHYLRTETVEPVFSDALEDRLAASNLLRMAQRRKKRKK